MYKEASKLSLRFTTPKGVLSVEQLWSLNQTDLSNTIKAVKKVLKTIDDDELSFLESSKVVDKENQLRFDILKDIYLTKKAEAEAIKNIADIKEHNQKILTLITQKQDEELGGKSIDELRSMLK